MAMSKVIKYHGRRETHGLGSGTKPTTRALGGEEPPLLVLAVVII